ncbi:MAG TPA: molybdate ABC transporter substrate-binding protein, partial [Thermoanaerobaculia bacterium]|nr:molybdate ABC transporter substrate-binding protein [Thermoanaerobaculia bacterium]
MKQLLAGVLLLLPSLMARAEEILVFAAASLTESMQEIGKAYESQTGTVVRFSFGASSDLARQIKAGAPADVFFSADTAKMDDVERAGLVRHEDRREFLSNVLVVVVPASANRTVTGPRDLLGLARLALADPASVPAGIYAKKWLESAGLWKEIEPRVVPSLDVRAALAAVESEAVPAAIVYKTDAAISRKVKVALEVTDGPEIIYSLARVAASKQRAAQGFVDFVDSKTGRKVFVRRGF